MWKDLMNDGANSGNLVRLCPVNDRFHELIPTRTLSLAEIFLDIEL